MNFVIYMRPSSTCVKGKRDYVIATKWSVENIFFSRFIDLYGDISPALAEEDKKIFDLWMENWIEQRQNDFFFSFGSLDSIQSSVSNSVNSHNQ